MRRAAPTRICTCIAALVARPERSESSRVKGVGGAVYMLNGELVFDGVAISDTSVEVRRAGRSLAMYRGGRAVSVPCAE